MTMPPIGATTTGPSEAVHAASTIGETRESLPWLAILALHLLPGLLIGATFVLLARVLAAAGTPANLALLLAMLLVALPVELGGLLWLGRRRRGGWVVNE